MANQEFVPKENTTPEGGWRNNSENIIVYSLTRKEAVNLIAGLGSFAKKPASLVDFQ